MVRAQTFRSGNLSNPMVWLAMLFLAIMFVLCMWAGLINLEIPFLFLADIPLMLFCFFWFRWFSVVTISEANIQLKSIIGKKIMTWENIKTTGVYITSKYASNPLQKNQVNDFMPGQKYFYLSSKEDLQPSLFLWLRKDVIDIMYRKEIFDTIKETLDEKKVIPLWNGGAAGMDCCN